MLLRTSFRVHLDGKRRIHNTYQKVNLNLLLLFGNDDSSKPLVHTSRPRVTSDW